MRKVLLVLLAFLAIRLGGRALARNAQVTALLWLMIEVLATANTPKAMTTEQRVANLVAATGTVTTNLNNLTSRVSTLEAGTFVNVNGSTVQITGFGGGNLYITALSLWTNGSQVNYLNTLNQQPNTNVPPTAPGTYTSTWGNNVVGAINNLRVACANSQITHT